MGSKLAVYLRFANYLSELEPQQARPTDLRGVTMSKVCTLTRVPGHRIEVG